MYIQYFTLVIENISIEVFYKRRKLIHPCTITIFSYPVNKFQIFLDNRVGLRYYQFIQIPLNLSIMMQLLSMKEKVKSMGEINYHSDYFGN